MPLSETAVNDCQAGPSGELLFAEVAATQQANTERLKVFWANPLHPGNRASGRLECGRSAFNLKFAVHAALTREWQTSRSRHRFHPRQRSEARAEALVEIHKPNVVRISEFGQGQAGREQLFRLKSPNGPAHLEKLLHCDQSAGQQYNRQRDLPDDQSVTQALRSLALAMPAAVLKRSEQINFGGGQRGSESEEQS